MKKEGRMELVQPASTGVYGFVDEFLNMLVKYALRNSGAWTDLEVTCSSF
jgi:hypothetical protein